MCTNENYPLYDNYLVHVEDEVKFTHVFKTAIKSLHKYLYTRGGVASVCGQHTWTHLNKIENSELTFTRVHTKHKIERGVVSVDKTKITSSKFTIKVWRSYNYRTVHRKMGLLTKSPLGSCRCCRLYGRLDGRPL